VKPLLLIEPNLEPGAWDVIPPPDPNEIAKIKFTGKRSKEGDKSDTTGNNFVDIMLITDFTRNYTRISSLDRG